MISTIGITENARPIEIAYSVNPRCTKSKMFARKGISMIAVVRMRDATIAI